MAAHAWPPAQRSGAAFARAGAKAGPGLSLARDKKQEPQRAARCLLLMQAAGGLTVGVLPGSDAAEMSSAVDIPILTGMGRCGEGRQRPVWSQGPSRACKGRCPVLTLSACPCTA